MNFRKKSTLSIKKINALKEQIKMKLSNYLEIENILQIGNSFTNPLCKKKVKSLDAIEQVVRDLRNE